MPRKVVTRFAPSPTGMLHIGGVRTALFCWLYARKHGGSFILRIEDTDLTRSTDENIEVIEKGMLWCGLDWDEGPEPGDPARWRGPHGPYRQMQRMDSHYRPALEKLLAEGQAYRCRCTREQLEQGRAEAERAGRIYQYPGTCRDANHDASEAFAIRLKMPKGDEPWLEAGCIVLRDLIKGELRFPAASLDDWILARSDGTPTYNFCVVVDDTSMEVSHVIRGDDHVANTPKQIALYHAMGYGAPAFAHVPMILGKDGAKLSKRHGATSITEYQAMGLLPSAVRLALARLSWTPKIDGRAVESAEEELLTDAQMIELFDLEDCQKSPARFDMDKLNWMNQKLIQRSSWRELEPHLRPFLDAIAPGAWDSKTDAWKEVAVHATQKGKGLGEMAEALRFAFQRPTTFDPKGVEKFLTDAIKPALREVLTLTDYAHHSPGLANRTGCEADGPKGGAQDERRHDALERDFTAILERRGLKLKDLAQALRVALCGAPVSPPIFDTLYLLGPEEVRARVQRWI